MLLHLLLTPSCSSSKKFVGEDKEETSPPNKEVRFGKEEAPAKEQPAARGMPVRVLVEESAINLSFTVETPLTISSEGKIIAVVKNGNGIKIQNNTDEIIVSINGNTFQKETFQFSSEGNEIFSFNGKKYRGSILVSSNNKIVNVIPLEDYLKGVLPAEMPLGKDNENFEALKAFAICARTYTMMKLNENKPDFDLYIDVRDQVYGGAEKEKELSNKAVAATAGMVLQYSGELAGIFYHASCGGYTEEGGNVFAQGNKPYLTMVKDGDDPYCIITPRFEWEEKYSLQEFVNRLYKAGLISSKDFQLKAININSRFSSGRVNEMQIELESDITGSKEVKIYGNQIRSIIRTSDDKGILRSTMFNVTSDSDSITISGKGYGHGVGLCQWGAIAQSRLGKGYLEIIQHYFPGTEVKQLTMHN